MTRYKAPMCMDCARLHGPQGVPYTVRGFGFRCDAYPLGIPDAIIHGSVDHRQPYEGDNGLQFVPKEAPVRDQSES